MLKDKDFLIAGQLFTSRTETIEDYLIHRVKRLGVVGFAGCFLPSIPGRLSYYEGGVLKKNSKLFSFYIKDYAWYRRPLVIVVFLAYFLDLIYALVILKRKFDIFLGVACFSGFIGLMLKKTGVVRHLIYYCLDYYVPEKKISFNSFFVRAINRIDKTVVSNSDAVWNLSPKITEVKERYLALRDKTITVPLGYSSRLKRAVPFQQMNRWDIVFSGTVTFNQGLQLMADALPEMLKKFSRLKVHIIGRGPFSKELSMLVEEKRLGDYFIFHGFIQDENRMLDIISRSALGLAIWDDSLENENVKFADSGKPKLYAVCGIPMIVTRVSSIADEVSRRKAGVVIDYNSEALQEALDYLLRSDGVLSLYRQNAVSFAEECTSEYIFASAFERTADILAR